MSSEISAILLLVVTLLGIAISTRISLKRYKATAEKDKKEYIKLAITEAISDVKERADIEKRIALLEQEVTLGNDHFKKELLEIKTMLTELFKRLNEHIIAST